MGMRPVHPRTCGEHLRREVEAFHDVGSSPHLRGTPPDRTPAPAAERFIPAPAGNTSCRSGGRTSRPVHPRTCGEHLRLHSTSSRPNGSSPHLRGTHWPPYGSVSSVRFIPAPAGNTAPSADRPTASPVHPRTCGEHPGKSFLKERSNGSSPHLRGTPLL